MAIVHRMNVLKAKLLNLRFGPGAATLPPEIKGIHLDFAFKINNGHFGARKLWRLYLPRLKYHNPTVSMTTSRTIDQSAPATMTITFVSSEGAVMTSSVDQNGSMAVEMTEVIDMKHKHESEILKQLMEITRATEVRPTNKEQEELRQIGEFYKKSEKDRALEKIKLEAKRQEEEMLRQAQGASA